VFPEARKKLPANLSIVSVTDPVKPKPGIFRQRGCYNKKDVFSFKNILLAH